GARACRSARSAMTSRRLTTSVVTTTVVAWLAACIVTAGAVDPPSTETPQPPPSLSGTGLYADGTHGPLADGVRAYAPQYPLWSDGLTKRRWIALPEGATIDGT